MANTRRIGQRRRSSLEEMSAFSKAASASNNLAQGGPAAPARGRRASIAVAPSANSMARLVPPGMHNTDRSLFRKDDEARAIEKEASLAWKVLSNTQTQALQDSSVEDVEKKLSEILKLTNSEIDLSESVLLDYYVCGFWWAKERGFTTQQLSGFFTVLHQLLENIREKQLSLADNLLEFRKMLVGIGADNNSPSKGLDFFDLEHAKAITDFLQGTLFQHHKMYEFLFHSERTEEIVGTELVVDVLPPAAMPYPPPLDEGLSEEVYLRHVAPPPPTPTPEPQPQEEDTEEEAGTDIKRETPKLSEEQVGAAEAASLVEPEALLASVTAEEVKTMFDRVSKELFAGLQGEISEKLLEREAEIIGRINKIHRVAEA